MEEQTPQDKRIETVKERLHEELVDDQGRPADDDIVNRAVDAAAEPLAGAPVQEFAPLLIEHQVRDELRQQGLHRDVRDDESDPSGDAVNDRHDDTDDQGNGRNSVHLATQQGLAAPRPDSPAGRPATTGDGTHLESGDRAPRTDGVDRSGGRQSVP